MILVCGATGEPLREIGITPRPATAFIEEEAVALVR